MTRKIFGATRNDRGFSLLEVIISIAALSFISVFILQMFLVSSSLNKRAGNVDAATAEAVTAVENFKKHARLGGWLASEEAAGAVSDGGVISVLRYYDDSWEPLVFGQTEDMPADTRFCLRMHITPDGKYQTEGGPSRGALYNVGVSVEELTSAENRKTLVSLQAKKYFPLGA